MKQKTVRQQPQVGRIQGLSRQVRRGHASGSVVRPGEGLGRRLPLTWIELAVLVAGFGALAALMTSCSNSQRAAPTSGAADGELITTGLNALLDPKSKQPRLNKPAEVTRDSAYQKLADQAKVDYEALFNRDPKAPAQAGAVTRNDSKVHAEPPAPEVTLVESTPEASAAPVPDVELPPQKIVPRVVKATPKAEGVKRALEATNSEAVAAEAARVEATKAAAAAAAAAAKVEVVSTAAPAEPSAAFFKGSHALLASKVSGFGRYEMLPSRPGRGNFVFQSARSNRAILYVELENFGYRPVKAGDPDRMPGDEWAVDLTTELQLLDAHDGMLQMKEPERGVVETCRNKRRDFYLVQEIELPPTLTVGTYNLKVILRDKSGAEAVRAEAVIPVQIVADLAAIVDE